MSVGRIPKPSSFGNVPPRRGSVLERRYPEEEQNAISTEVSSTLEWARTATLAARSHTQRKLILLRRESAYTPSIRKNEVLNLNA